MEITKLRAYFLRRHLRSRALVGPNEYGRDVKAFCVLSHAALEQCFEDTAHATVLFHCDQFMNNQHTSQTLLALLIHHGKTVAPSDDRDTLSIRSFDTLRSAVDAAKESYSRAVHNNNGITFPDLSALLSPAALDLQPSADEATSFKKLKAERGQHAHNSIAQQILSPEDASRHVYRCLSVARSIAIKASVICGLPAAGIKPIRIP